MRLASKNEQILHVYFVEKKPKKNVFIFFLYIIFILRI